jgi:hypothetical protein
VWFTFLFFDNFSINFILQLCLLFGLYNFFFIKTPFKALIILFYFIVIFGAYLVILNLELFTAFLWFLEFTLVFLTVLFILQNSLNIIFFKKINHVLTLILFFFFCAVYASLFKYNLQIQNYNFIFWTSIFTDYYNLNKNYNLNDLFGFFLAYYVLNNYTLILILLLIFVASFLCIFLVKFFLKKNSEVSLNFLIKFFNKNFLRKQTLSKQATLNNSTKIFKKK